MFRHARRVGVWAVIGIVSFTSTAQSEVIILKDGREIRGKIISRTDKAVKVEVKQYGVTVTRTLRRARIKSILKDGATTSGEEGSAEATDADRKRGTGATEDAAPIKPSAPEAKNEDTEVSDADGESGVDDESRTGTDKPTEKQKGPDLRKALEYVDLLTEIVLGENTQHGRTPTKARGSRPRSGRSKSRGSKGRSRKGTNPNDAKAKRVKRIAALVRKNLEGEMSIEGYKAYAQTSGALHVFLNRKVSQELANDISSERRAVLDAMAGWRVAWETRFKDALKAGQDTQADEALTSLLKMVRIPLTESPTRITDRASYLATGKVVVEDQGFVIESLEWALALWNDGLTPLLDKGEQEAVEASKASNESLDAMKRWLANKKDEKLKEAYERANKRSQETVAAMLESGRGGKCVAAMKKYQDFLSYADELKRLWRTRGQCVATMTTLGLNYQLCPTCHGRGQIQRSQAELQRAQSAIAERAMRGGIYSGSVSRAKRCSPCGGLGKLWPNEVFQGEEQVYQLWNRLPGERQIIDGYLAKIAGYSKPSRGD